MWDRFLFALSQRIRAHILLVVFLGGVLVCAGSSLHYAHWIKDDRAELLALGYGVLLGWALAGSRLKGGFALVFSVVITCAASVQAVGGILPSLDEVFSTPFFQWVNAMNLRLVVLELRAAGWLDTINANQDLKDTGLFVSLVVLMVCAAIFWLMWFVIRKRRALVGLLPIGCLLALNISLSRQSLTDFGVFLVFTLLLMARDTVIFHHHDWQVRHVDYPEQLEIGWGASVVLIALLVVGAARLAPLLGTPEGWRAISDWVKSTHQQSADTAHQLFAGVNTPPPPESKDKPRVGVATPNLGDVGSPLPQGVETIMWVSTSDPAPIPEEIISGIHHVPAKSHYWRSAIFGTYTGRGWLEVPLSSRAEPQPDLADGQKPPADHYFLRQTYEIVADHTERLFGVSDPVKADQRVSLHKTVPDGSPLLEGTASIYSVVSAAAQVSGDELALAPTTYPDAIRAAYLQLPSELPGRVRTLAERVVGSATDPFHKALFIQNYLRQNYKYNLDIPFVPSGHDVVDDFLFVTQQGFCSHFASAMVVMLRTQDVPARIATGYATGIWDNNRQAYQVEISSAHAWVEVYFPGYGWIEFEPTASLAPFIYTEAGKVVANSEPLPAVDKQTTAAASPLVAVLLALVFLALVALPFWLLRVFSTHKDDPALQINALYHQIRLALGWAGIAAPASLTPSEFLIKVGPDLAQYDHLQRALRQTTDLYCQAAYSPHPPDRLKTRIASQWWQNSLGEWILLWARDRFDKLKRS